MDGEDITPSEMMKILGVLIDEQLTWEPHNAAAASKADRARMATARATRSLSRKERTRFVQALAHPYLDYCQSALVAPTQLAEESLRRAYNRTARMAARVDQAAATQWRRQRGARHT